MSSSRSSSTDDQSVDDGGSAVARPARSWHSLAVADVTRALDTDPACGLTLAQAATRLSEVGPNAIREGIARGPLAMLFAQFTDFMILVLIAAAIVAGVVGEPQDAISIVVIVVLNAIIGFAQENRAEKAIVALKKIAAPMARVRRDGMVSDVAAVGLVPGDVVVLEAGSLVPADLRIVEAAQLRTDESALTGESQPVDKIVDALPADLPLAERRNMTFKGTLVTQGRGVALVVATGMDTELGRIAALLTSAQTTQTPLQRRLAKLGSRLALVVLAICAVILVAGLLRGEPLVLMFLTAVSLAVAAIPEALPAVVTVSLALGARKMVQKHALIRRLPAVETLGSVTYICSDKTGTLTRNRMRVEVVFAAGREKKLEAGNAMEGNPWPLLFQAMALNNDASFDREGRAVGDPTETALLEAARDAGWDRDALTEALPRVGELPFDSTRKRMSTLHCEAARGEMDTWVVFVKGAPEETLACCSVQLGRDGIEVLDRAAVLATADMLAARGYRVLGFALRRIEMARERPANDELERDLVFLGFAGLIDPVRPEAASAVDECRSAGITPVMITGDHPATAGAIARELGIVDAGGEVVSGPELAQMDDAALAARVRDIRVYARVDPEQKIRIVRALQARGEFVAMTGDGVNDAPALKRADIGVAMGKGGTDVAREAAAMVLLDDNFATIVSAVREGRRIFDNIRKFLKYSMTGNAGTVWTIFLAPLAGLPIPLLPIQILWINLATDGLPGLALANERAEPNVMQRPPRPPNESMFAHGMGQHIVWVGLAIAAVCVPLQAWAWHAGNSHWQTMIFTVLCFSRLAQCISIRSENHSVFTIGFWSNPLLMGAVLLTVALHLATIYVPALNPIFKTEPLDVAELTLCFAVSTIVFFTVEIEKWLIRRRLIYTKARPQKSV